MPSPDLLTVWLHEEPVADLTRRSNGRLILRYRPEILELHPSAVPLLSCSLPTSTASLDATAFVDGLLPEGEVRRVLAERADLSALDLFGLVRRYGRDVAGAVQFLEPGAEPSSADYDVEPLNDNDLDDLVDELDTNPLAIIDESELSIAGLQAKMLLVDMGDNQWGRPLGGRPSTHILKRDHSVHRGIVAAELEALTLAQHVGLCDFDARIEQFAGYDCLIVERYDRVVDADGAVGRIHQEDSCQALGLPARQKYEMRQGGGGPEFRQIAALLDKHAAEPLDQLDRLMRVAVFTALVGNAGAHGKNVALILGEKNISLAPTFDTVPTVLWPKLNADAAMSVGGAVSMHAVSQGAVAREARSWRHSETSAVEAAVDCAQQMRQAIDDGVIDAAGNFARHVAASTDRFLASE